MEELVGTETAPDRSRQFHDLLEKLPVGAYTCDPEGLITYFNRNAARVWGRKPKLNHPDDRFCGSFKLYAIDGTPINHDKCWMALALQQNLEFHGHEIVVERPDGERITVLAHVNPIHDEDGRVLGALNVVVDISERKRLESALKEADRSKNEFLAMLSHELRNPLNPIRNAVEILHLKSPASPDVQWALDVIDRQMRQLTRLIDDLLDVSRITSNKLELHAERVQLAEILHAAAETSRPLIDACGLEFTISLPPQPIDVDVDRIRLGQAVSNLLNNAAQSTPRGGRVCLIAERIGSEASITVSDTGVGIPSDLLTRVFDMFMQVDRSLERKNGGLGIGLTLVKRIVEMHGGTIVAQSEGAGAGSQFIVRLPAAHAASSRRSRRTIRQHAPSAPSLRVLIADDNHDSTVSMGMLLRMMGSEIRTAEDGSEAVRVAGEFAPHVAILDICLPEMNGYQVARALRGQPGGDRMVLIAVTGRGQDEDRARSREAGFDHHMVKPVEPPKLMELLASLQRSLAS